MGEVTLDWSRVVKSLGNRSRVDPGVTCVALFKTRRPWVFDALIDWFHEVLRLQLSEWLRKGWVKLASADQIHITLIGMEASFDRGELVNKNLKEIMNGVENGAACDGSHWVFPISPCNGGTNPAEIRRFLG